MAEHVATTPSADPVAILAQARKAGLPGIERVLAALAASPRFTHRLMAEILPDPSRMAAALGALSADGEGADAVGTVLRYVGIALSCRFGRLPGEDDAALVARALLSSGGIWLPAGPLRKGLAEIAHPDFRAAFLAIVCHPTGRTLHMRTRNDATPEIIGRLLEVPHTGHLVAALPRTERADTALRAIALGRAGVLAALPDQLATPETYRLLSASPELIDAVDLHAIGDAHISAAAAAGMDAKYRARLAAARYAIVTGPTWLVEATRAHERYDCETSHVLGPVQAAGRVLAGGTLRDTISDLVRHGRLPAIEAREAIRLALAESPWIAVKAVDVAPLLAPVTIASALAHPELARWVDPDALGLADALALAAHLPARTLGVLGSALPEAPATCSWSPVATRLLGSGVVQPAAAAALLRGLTLDSDCPEDVAAAGRLMAIAGAVRPRRADGSRWPWPRFLAAAARGLAMSGFRLDRFLPGAHRTADA